MGGIVTKQSADQVKDYKSGKCHVQDVINKSNHDQTECNDNDNSVTEVKWKILPTGDEAKLKYEKDGTLKKVNDCDRLELRMMLDDPIAQKSLALFAKERQTLDIFMCWVDAHEYKSIPTKDYRRSKALHIYHKYIKPDAVLEIGGIDGLEKLRIAKLIEESKSDPNVLKTDLFERVQVRYHSNKNYH